MSLVELEGGGGGGGGTVPGGTVTVGTDGFGSSLGPSVSSSTLPSCTFFFFPSRSSPSVLKRLVLP